MFVLVIILVWVHFNLCNKHYKQVFSGSTVAECLSRDRGAVGSSLTCVTELRPGARHNNPCSELVQPRETRPDINEKVLTGM